MENTTTVTQTKAQKILSIVATVLVTVYIVCALIFSISVFTSMKTGHPRVFGHTLLYIETDSMEGKKEDSLFVDDLVVCKEVDTDDLKVGDIIAFDALMVESDENGNPVGEPFTIIKIHRIVEDRGSNFITRGDNSPDENNDGVPDDDAPVKKEDVLGVYTGTRIAKVGAVTRWFSSQTGILCIFVIPMALFFVYALYRFIKAMLEYRMSKAPAGGLSDAQKQAAIEEYLAKQKEYAPPAEDKDENN